MLLSESNYTIDTVLCLNTLEAISLNLSKKGKNIKVLPAYTSLNSIYKMLPSPSLRKLEFEFSVFKAYVDDILYDEPDTKVTNYLNVLKYLNHNFSSGISTNAFE